MGQSFEHICPDCGYSAEVSGGKDIGMAAVTVTVTCHDCKALHDAVAKEHPSEVWDGEFFAEPTGYFCPKDKAHKITPWSYPGPCPKCGSVMERGHEGMLWD